MSIDTLKDYVFTSKYARYVPEKKRRETFEEAVERVMNMHRKHFNDKGIDVSDLIDRCERGMKSKMILGSQRAMQFGGEPILRKNSRLYNCSGSYCDRPRFFQEAMWLLLCGSGVGFSVQKHHVEKLPKIQKPNKKDTATHVIDDSIEGWADAIGVLLSCYFVENQPFPEYFGKTVTFDYSSIRAKGKAISSGTGKAPGPEPLKRSIDIIRDFINQRLEEGFDRLRSVDAYDIIMHSSDAVLSGGVRRCLPEGTKVHTKRGMINIEDVLTGDEVLNSKGYNKVINNFYQGRQKTLVIKTQDGSFECTPNHKMAVWDSVKSYKWVMAKDIKKDDRLVITRKPIEGVKTSLPKWVYKRPASSTTCKDITIPELDEQTAWFLGVFHSDGYVFFKEIGNNEYSGGSLSVCLHSEEYEVAVKVKEQLERWTTNKVSIKPRKGEKCYNVVVKCKQLSKYFYENIKQPKTSIEIPDFIMNSTVEIRKAYLAGMVDGDGCLVNKPFHLADTVYSNFANQLQTLAYSCGFETRISRTDDNYKSREGWQILYSVNLISEHSIRKVNEIPTLNKISSERKQYHRASSFPNEFIRDEKFIKGKREMGFFSSDNTLFDTLIKYNPELDLGIAPCAVIGIEDGRFVETFDIEVEENHEFFANGYLTHNSATLALFSPDDDLMASAKTGNWLVDNPQRARSNNSAMLIRGETTREQFAYLMSNVREFGEPGFIFSDNKDGVLNPCAEIQMYPQIDGKSGFAFCNLCEINMGIIDTPHRFLEACELASILGTLQADYTDFEYLGEVSQAIAKSEALLGVSMTGMMEHPSIAFDPELQRKGAKIILETNEKIARRIGINPCARATCLKPSGTASGLLGTSSGIHPHHAKRYLRRAQSNADDVIVKHFQSINPMAVEKSVWNPNGTDLVLSFCVEAGEDSITKRDVNALDLLKKVKLTKENWIDAGKRTEACAQPWLSHNVSNTISVKDEEWDEVEEYIYENRNIFAGISLLADGGDLDYPQAPFCEVLSAKELVEYYGHGAIFASGLVEEGKMAFDDNLWAACDAVLGKGEDLTTPTPKKHSKRSYEALEAVRENKLRWVEEAKEFSEHYFGGDIKKMTRCLKRVSLRKIWDDLKRSYKPVDYTQLVEIKDTTKVSQTMACSGGTCELI